LDSLFHCDQGCKFSIIIVDDGSTDGSLALLQEYQTIAEEKNQEYLIISIHHQGLSHALDKGILQSTTEFIARLDIDDVSCKNRLRRQVEFLSYNRHIHVVGSQACKFTDDGSHGEVSEISSSILPVITMYDHPLLVQFASYFHCPILHPSVMFRKDTIVDCGLYSWGKENFSDELGRSEFVSYIEDYYLWCRLQKRCVCRLFSLI
jgi:glycosyltransferase involved in cell wall biosynthesis